MRNHKFILIMSLLSLLQTACHAAKAPTEPIRHFEYSYIGTIGGGSFTWSVDRDEDGTVRFTLNDHFERGYDNISENVPAAFMDSIEALCRKHKVYRWDGYNETDRRVCDGSGFSIAIRYADGQRVDVYGMNSSPHGYRAFRDELYELCTPMRDHMREIGRQRKIEAGVQGPLQSVLAIFTNNSAPAPHYEYHVLIRSDQIVENNVEIRIKNSDGTFFPEGDSTYYGRVPNEQIGWSDFEALVRKHKLIQWCDFHQNATDNTNYEWFQIAFRFEQGDIQAYGSGHPEHYEAFRNDFLRLLAKKIKKWQINK